MGARGTGPGIVVIALVAVGSGSSASADFTDVAADVDLTRNSTKEGGFTFADFDGDGDLDALVLAGSSRLYLSSGGADPTFTDVTAERAPGLTADGADRSAIAADLDNDGDVDFLRTNNDLIEVYFNRGPPDYTFGDGATPDFVVSPATDSDLNAEGAGVLDYDNDGWLDIVVDNDGPIRIFRNPADGTANFVLVPYADYGIPGPADVMRRDGDYLAITDFDVDGFVDIGSRNVDLDTLYANDGDGTFTGIPMPVLESTNDTKGGMVFCDFDADGRFDFFYSDGTGPGINRVYLQTAPRVFENTDEPAISTNNIDGVACGDVDNDGDEDLFVARSGTDTLFINQLAETGVLAWVEDNRGITGGANGEGASFVDYDQDGDLDLYVAQTGPCMTDPMTMMTTCEGRPNNLWRNDAGGDHLAVRVRARVRGCADGGPVHRDDHGAVLDVRDEASGWSSGVREVNGGFGHGNQGSPIVHFGLPLGSDREYLLTVRFVHGTWPDAPISVTPATLGDYRLLTVDASDPDADSIPTDVEMADFGGAPDIDGDGLPAWHDADADGDGIDDAIEAGDDDPCTPPVDADANGVPDYVEGPTLPDGGIPPGPDGGGPFDGGPPPPPGLSVHGSGCLGSVTNADRFGAPAALLLLVLLVSVRRARSARGRGARSSPRCARCRGR